MNYLFSRPLRVFLWRNLGAELECVGRLIRNCRAMVSPGNDYSPTTERRVHFGTPVKLGKRKGSGISFDFPVSAVDFLTKVTSILDSEEDRGKLFDALRTYHENKKIKRLVRDLKLVLNSSKRFPLFKEIRSLIPPEHLIIYDKLTESARTGERLVRIKKHGADTMGFLFRGGKEHGVGFFVTSIIPGSPAHVAGLKIGDEIRRINGLPLQECIQEEVVNILKAKASVTLVVKSGGHIPKKIGNTIVWEQVDVNAAIGPANLALTLARNGEHKDDRLLAFKVGEEGLGCSIRTGISRHDGVYVSAIGKDSLADSIGLKVGDRILDVNGKDFTKITHAEAVEVLRSKSQLTMIVRHYKNVEDIFRRRQAIAKQGIRSILVKEPRGTVGKKTGFGSSVILEYSPEASDEGDPQSDEDDVVHPGRSNFDYSPAFLAGRDVQFCPIAKTGPLGMDLKSKDGKIVVRNIVDGGAVARHGFIKTGDWILNVEGEELVGVSLEDANQAIIEAMSRWSKYIEFLVACPPGRPAPDIPSKRETSETIKHAALFARPEHAMLHAMANDGNVTDVKGAVMAFELISAEAFTNASPKSPFRGTGQPGVPQVRRMDSLERARKTVQVAARDRTQSRQTDHPTSHSLAGQSKPYETETILGSVVGQPSGSISQVDQANAESATRPPLVDALSFASTAPSSRQHGASANKALTPFSSLHARSFVSPSMSRAFVHPPASNTRNPPHDHSQQRVKADFAQPVAQQTGMASSSLISNNELPSSAFQAYSSAATLQSTSQAGTFSSKISGSRPAFSTVGPSYTTQHRRPLIHSSVVVGMDDVSVHSNSPSLRESQIVHESALDEAKPVARKKPGPPVRPKPLRRTKSLNDGFRRPAAFNKSYVSSAAKFHSPSLDRKWVSESPFLSQKRRSSSETMLSSLIPTQKPFISADMSSNRVFGNQVAGVKPEVGLHTMLLKGSLSARAVINSTDSPADRSLPGNLMITSSASLTKNAIVDQASSMRTDPGMGAHDIIRNAKIRFDDAQLPDSFKVSKPAENPVTLKVSAPENVVDVTRDGGDKFEPPLKASSIIKSFEAQDAAKTMTAGSPVTSVSKMKDTVPTAYDSDSLSLEFHEDPVYATVGKPVLSPDKSPSPPVAHAISVRPAPAGVRAVKVEKGFYGPSTSSQALGEKASLSEFLQRYERKEHSRVSLKSLPDEGDGEVFDEESDDIHATKKFQANLDSWVLKEKMVSSQETADKLMEDLREPVWHDPVLDVGEVKSILVKGKKGSPKKVQFSNFVAVGVASPPPDDTSLHEGRIQPDSQDMDDLVAGLQPSTSTLSTHPSLAGDGGSTNWSGQAFQNRSFVPVPPRDYDQVAFRSNPTSQAVLSRGESSHEVSLESQLQARKARVEKPAMKEAQPKKVNISSGLLQRAKEKLIMAKLNKKSDSGMSNTASLSGAASTQPVTDNRINMASITTPPPGGNSVGTVMSDLRGKEDNIMSRAVSPTPAALVAAGGSTIYAVEETGRLQWPAPVYPVDAAFMMAKPDFSSTTNPFREKKEVEREDRIRRRQSGIASTSGFEGKVAEFNGM